MGKFYIDKNFNPAAKDKAYAVKIISGRKVSFEILKDNFLSTPETPTTIADVLNAIKEFTMRINGKR